MSQFQFWLLGIREKNTLEGLCTLILLSRLSGNSRQMFEGTISVGNI